MLGRRCLMRRSSGRRRERHLLVAAPERWWGSSKAPWHVQITDVDDERMIKPTQVGASGLGRVLESREPVLVAAGCEGNPTTAWPALGAWWSYSDR